MNYYQFKDKQKREKNRINNYILKNMKTIRNNQNINNIDSINEEELNTILEIIEKELEVEENNIIKTAVEYQYNKNKLKNFLNKDKYIEKYTNFYKNIFNRLNNIVCKKNNIESRYGLYYCDLDAIELLNLLLKKHFATTIFIRSKMTNLYKFYAEVTKELYFLSNNKKELTKIYNYKKIRRDHIINNLNNQRFLIEQLDTCIKTLQYKINDTIGNGFFGL